MNRIRTKEATFLFIGDVIVLFVALYLALTLRYGALPSQDTLWLHLGPFTFIFIIALLFNFIGGLYEKHTLTLKKKIPFILIQVQVVNTLVAVGFFYVIPYFLITPKIVLLLYLALSLLFMVAWRMSVAESLGGKRKNRALLIAEGKEARELHAEIEHNSRYSTTFVEWIDLSSTSIQGEQVVELIKSKGITLIVADFRNSKVNHIMPVLYRSIFSGVQFIDVEKLYEETFDRAPLSLLDDTWFVENISTASKISFDIFKRSLDIVTSIIFGIVSLIFYPFIILAIKLDDRGVIFSYQNRVGQNNKVVRIVKFRTMTIANDDAKWEAGKNTVTKVGNILRKSRLDELPQFWNVLIGDLSLVGPRPEFPDPVSSYSDSIPYYNIRHIIKPGLFGWAQIQHQKHPHHGLDIEETKNKLSYDLFYIKNRSLFLELKIILQTLKIIVSFVGR